MKKFRLSLILLFLPIIIQAGTASEILHGSVSKILYGVPYGYDSYQGSITGADRIDYELVVEYSGYPPYNGWAYAEFNGLERVTANFSNPYDYTSGYYWTVYTDTYTYRVTVSDQGSASASFTW